MDLRKEASRKGKLGKKSWRRKQGGICIRRRAFYMFRWFSAQDVRRCTCSAAHALSSIKGVRNLHSFSKIQIQIQVEALPTVSEFRLACM